MLINIFKEPMPTETIIVDFTNSSISNKLDAKSQNKILDQNIKDEDNEQASATNRDTFEPGHSSTSNPDAQQTSHKYFSSIYDLNSEIAKIAPNNQSVLNNETLMQTDMISIPLKNNRQSNLITEMNISIQPALEFDNVFPIYTDDPLKDD